MPSVLTWLPQQPATEGRPSQDSTSVLLLPHWKQCPGMSERPLTSIAGFTRQVSNPKQADMGSWAGSSLKKQHTLKLVVELQLLEWFNGCLQRSERASMVTGHWEETTTPESLEVRQYIHWINYGLLAQPDVWIGFGTLIYLLSPS